jgi:hypothetical protein
VQLCQLSTQSFSAIIHALGTFIMAVKAYFEVIRTLQIPTLWKEMLVYEHSFYNSEALIQEILVHFLALI